MASIDDYRNEVILKTAVTYFVMDALLLNDLKSNIDVLDKENYKEEIEIRLFPYCYFPFLTLKISSQESKVKLYSNQIRGVEEKEIPMLSSEDHPFTSETGILIFIVENKLTKFLKLFDYDLLVNSDTDILNWEFWNAIVKEFEENEIEMLLASDAKGENEFCGDGVYKIENVSP